MIDLSSLYFGANGAFKPFIGRAPFSGEDATGEVRYEYDAASRSVMVYVSADPSSDAEGVLRIMGISSLSVSDFNFWDW
ncbi:hypothetical protein HK414_02605 [Ramlibacter terrae]|uniref:Uncharacterized protein n=1 Tax=Ramlibacter terrae TaxID=2732511 RepID=A0ABX6P378_9BURK|nr:hypothetical protein HK414_02605 [Ramlibacter terrae]